MDAALDRIRELHRASSARDAAPAWLAARRADALARFLDSGFPSLKDEDWRYTNLRSLRETDFIVAPSAAVSGESPAIDVSGWHMTLSGVGPVRIASEPPAGVRVRALRDIDADDPLVAGRGFDGRPADAMALLNEAFLDDALVIEIAPDAVVETPLIVNWIAPHGAGLLASPRLLLVAGANSRATVMEHRVAGGGVCNGISELRVGPGARLDHVDVKREARDSHSIGAIHAHIARDAHLCSVSVALGGSLLRNDVKARLAESGASVALHGVFAVGENDHVDNHTSIDHIAADTRSEEDYRGIVGRLGQGVFNGKVIVREDAQRITSSQSNDNILLDDSAEIDTKPELQIHADDVRCSHGATVGRLDDDALFYLRARGVDIDGATRLLLDAFASHALQAIGNQALREALNAQLHDFIDRELLEGRS